MRTPPPALLPFLRSQVQGDLLALVYLNPDQEYSITEAAHRIGASVKAVHQEVTRLVEAGLLAVTYGPLPVLTRSPTGLEGVH